MREFIIRSGKGTGAKERVEDVHLEDVHLDEPLFVLGEPPPRHRKRRSRQRDFIIHYQGQFIGHYHSRLPISPRHAFGQVVHELRTRGDQFDPEQLALYHPVKLRVKNPTTAEVDASSGSFTWFD